MFGTAQRIIRPGSIAFGQLSEQRLTPSRSVKPEHRGSRRPRSCVDRSGFGIPFGSDASRVAWSAPGRSCGMTVSIADCGTMTAAQAGQARMSGTIRGEIYEFLSVILPEAI
jgi:hypothetical protein